MNKFFLPLRLEIYYLCIHDVLFFVTFLSRLTQAALSKKDFKGFLLLSMLIELIDKFMKLFHARFRSELSFLYRTEPLQ